jgi:hypothetical protein
MCFPDSWIAQQTTLGHQHCRSPQKVSHGLDKIQRTLHMTALSTSTSNTRRRGCRTELGTNHCWMWNWWCLNSQALSVLSMCTWARIYPFNLWESKYIHVKQNKICHSFQSHPTQAAMLKVLHQRSVWGFHWWHYKPSLDQLAVIPIYKALT